MSWLKRKLPLMIGGLVAVHYALYSQLLPNSQGMLGHDHAYNLPMLLDGYYWFLNNGPFSVPWFTPSFCGGIPQFGSPATFYLSVTQFLAFLVDPLTSLKLTFALFGALGFFGFYHLLVRRFAYSPWTGLLGGAIFLFNGLYAFRFPIGHMEFHGFMLVPWVAYFLIGVEPAVRSWRSTVRDTVTAGVLIAYMFMSGMTQLIVPAMLSVVLIGLARAMEDRARSFELRGFGARFCLAGVLSLCLCANKLVASLAFLGNFPRESYLLPGVQGVGRLTGLIIEVLSLGGQGVAFDQVISNTQWAMGRHEFEFGMTLVPFVLIVIGLVLNASRSRGFIVELLRSRRGVCLAGILAVLVVPLLLNSYTPAWNQMLKRTPMIGNLSNFIRWFCIYIPAVVLLAAAAIERTAVLRRALPALALVSVAFVLAQNLVTDREYYHQQSYDPQPVVLGHARARDRGRAPAVTEIVVSRNSSGQPIMTTSRNDALVNGQSQLLCYEPMFGFRLEFLPFEKLSPGPTLAHDGVEINLKNPACYLYPEENDCEPGDHFSVGQLDDARRFINYRPFAHQVSTAQRVANWLSLATLFALLLFAAFLVALAARSLLRPSRRGLPTA